MAVTDAQAERLRSGQAVQVIRGDAGLAAVTAGKRLVALAEVKEGRVQPVRVFNL